MYFQQLLQEGDDLRRKTRLSTVLEVAVKTGAVVTFELIRTTPFFTARCSTVRR